MYLMSQKSVKSYIPLDKKVVSYSISDYLIVGIVFLKWHHYFFHFFHKEEGRHYTTLFPQAGIHDNYFRVFGRPTDMVTTSAFSAGGQIFARRKKRAERWVVDEFHPEQSRPGDRPTTQLPQPKPRHVPPQPPAETRPARDDTWQSAGLEAV